MNNLTKKNKDNNFLSVKKIYNKNTRKNIKKIPSDKNKTNNNNSLDIFQNVNNIKNS
jgi:hypothetical protein